MKRVSRSNTSTSRAVTSPCTSKRHAELAHAREHGVDAADVGDAGVGVGGRAGGIELAAVHDAAGLRAVDFRGSVRSVRYSVISG